MQTHSYSVPAISCQCMLAKVTLPLSFQQNLFSYSVLQLLSHHISVNQLFLSSSREQFSLRALYTLIFHDSVILIMAIFK